MSLFWKWYMIVNGIAILAFFGTIVWAAFDIHNRLGFVLIAQVPALLMLGIRKVFR